jgi:hypothetical protein
MDLSASLIASNGSSVGTQAALQAQAPRPAIAWRRVAVPLCA